VFVVFGFLALVAWCLTLYHGIRSFAPYLRWRRKLQEQGIAPFGLRAGLPDRFLPELQLARRLFGGSPEQDPAAERERVEARGRLLIASRFVLWFIGLNTAAWCLVLFIDSVR
jgi:hypothetical protein